MAFRIGDYILRGELRNTRVNGVYGWIEFAPDYGIHIELTGNLKGALEGKHLKFTAPRGKVLESVAADNLPEELDELADRQIGVVGDVQLRQVRLPTIPPEEFAQLSRDEQARFSQEKECLFLEWFSQNGRIVAEIVSPDIEFVDSQTVDADPADLDAIDETRFGVGITEVYIDDNGVAHHTDYELEDDDEDGEDEDDDEDPYGLFDKDLDRSVAEALGAADGPPTGDDETTAGEPPTREGRRWDEVPGIDDETKALYEQWDEIFEGKKDEPVAYLFETPLKLPPPDKVSSDAEAEPLVTSILAQLALLSVAIDVCEHYTPLKTYQLLMTQILPTAKVHPNLAASQMVQHYSTSDYCDECDAEFDAEYEDGEDEEPSS